MGKIYYINKNPKTWHAHETNMTLKPEYGGEKLMKITYGECDDYPTGLTDLDMYMRKSIYQSIMSEEFRVGSKDGQTLTVYDNDGNEILPLTEGIIY